MYAVCIKMTFFNIASTHCLRPTATQTSLLTLIIWCQSTFCSPNTNVGPWEVRSFSAAASRLWIPLPPHSFLASKSLHSTQYNAWNAKNYYTPVQSHFLSHCPYLLFLILITLILFPVRYVERKNFLERVDQRQFKLERDVRLTNMKRWHSDEDDIINRLHTMRAHTHKHYHLLPFCFFFLFVCFVFVGSTIHSLYIRSKCSNHLAQQELFVH